MHFVIVIQIQMFGACDHDQISGFVPPKGVKQVFTKAELPRDVKSAINTPYPLQSGQLVSVFADRRRLGSKIYRVLCFFASSEDDSASSSAADGDSEEASSGRNRHRPGSSISSAAVRVALVPEPAHLLPPAARGTVSVHKPVELIDTNKSQEDLRRDLESAIADMQNQNPSSMLVCWIHGYSFNGQVSFFVMHVSNNVRLQLKFCWTKASEAANIPQLKSSPHFIGRKCAGFKFPFIQPRLLNRDQEERNKHNGNTIFIEETFIKCLPTGDWKIDPVCCCFPVIHVVMFLSHCVRIESFAGNASDEFAERVACFLHKQSLASTHQSI